jgi:hypothetical protein
MGPLDGFSATNHSKVIEAPMCFAMMQEKIRTQQYSTWRVFVVCSMDVVFWNRNLSPNSLRLC